MPTKYEEALPDLDCLPESLVGARFYEPTGRGVEENIAERLRQIRDRRKKPAQTTEK